MKRPMIVPLFVGMALCLAVPSSGRAQEDDKTPAKVLRALAADQAEDLLKGLNIEFKKSQGPKADILFYDFTRNNFKIRLHLFAGGKDLMVDAVFPGAPLDMINQWNLRARFTRAVLDRDKRGDFTAVESNLNLAGGVTAETVKLFLQSFDEELAAFHKFITNRPGDATIYATLTNDRIEAILKEGNVAHQKRIGQDGLGMFEFKAFDHVLRLHNFAGKDIMLDAHFPKISLADANRWNLSKKFIRTVVYNLKGNEYTALEANLEITGGVNDRIVRQFIAGFSEEIREFQAYVKNLNKKDEPKEDK